MGLADELIKHLTKEAKSYKELELRLYVNGDNGRAIRAYERGGFTESPYTIMRVGL
ncbi:GNAT family N-acetyltransferase [Citrobacter farmeri]|uniref:GNAT family N-acetyltransferase n=1 Tax=Citrobacter TaxID=544 RepID=UPI0010C9ABB7|nr:MULTISPECIES: GNAT family N-acetyltransferase [Citrobacter]MEC3934036.1 GNAT family N-acetyltransferase [Citrobacter farmeri]TKV08304.1 GNAT family N-acetyltransferase [Citrobacter sp. wls619]HCD2001350.1 GNAT family N-acetyltransferase [Citrobacter farmeri]HEM7437592.1 GNAT family N-acetyltransferase [Citrobacter amalonaticus]